MSNFYGLFLQVSETLKTLFRPLNSDVEQLHRKDIRETEKFEHFLFQLSVTLSIHQKNNYKNYTAD